MFNSRSLMFHSSQHNTTQSSTSICSRHMMIKIRWIITYHANKWYPVKSAGVGIIFCISNKSTTARTRILYTVVFVSIHCAPPKRADNSPFCGVGKGFSWRRQSPAGNGVWRAGGGGGRRGEEREEGNFHEGTNFLRGSRGRTQKVRMSPSLLSLSLSLFLSLSLSFSFYIKGKGPLISDRSRSFYFHPPLFLPLFSSLSPSLSPSLSSSLSNSLSLPPSLSLFLHQGQRPSHFWSFPPSISTLLSLSLSLYPSIYLSIYLSVQGQRAEQFWKNCLLLPVVSWRLKRNQESDLSVWGAEHFSPEVKPPELLAWIWWWQKLCTDPFFQCLLIIRDSNLLKLNFCS